MSRTLRVATLLFACAALAPACLLDAGAFQPDATGGAGGTGTTSNTGGTATTSNTGGTGNTGNTGNTGGTGGTGGTGNMGGTGGTGGSPSVCGDGAITSGEECDDDNAVAGDGCSPACAIEPGWSCAGEPSVCSETCGDGTLDTVAGEECEDGNLAPGDGCSAGCKIEAGWICDSDPLPSVCFADCGDEIIVPGEEGCDDGDTDGTSGCDQACSGPVLGWECDPVTGGKESCNPICGDTLVLGGEACDDGNPDSGDGCSAMCALESTCGNGIVEPSEECDGDGPGLDECDANCKLLDPALAVCKDAPLIPQGSLNLGNGSFEVVHEGANDPTKGGAPLLFGEVPPPVGCDVTYNAPVLHRYVTGSRPSFLTLETLETQPVGGQNTFDNTQIWVYRDCPRKADYEGCDNDGAAAAKLSKLTTGYIPAKTTLFIVVSGEGPGGGADNGYYALRIIEQPVKLFYHQDFGDETTPGLYALPAGMTDMITGDGDWRTCVGGQAGSPCFTKEPASHSRGAFGWAFSDAATQTTALLLTPVFDLSSVTAARASYAYRFTDNGLVSESGKAEPLDDGSVTSGAITYNPPVEGRSMVPLQTSQNARLRFTYEDGSSATAGTFAVDDIHVYGW